MARGQDAPIREGGQLDPYIQQSLSQGKQIANSRLITAMQESGATDRAQIASQTQIATTASRGRTDLKIEASRKEQADQVAAQTERSRRADQEFARFMQAERQSFETERDALVREQGIADRKDDRAYANELQEKIDARQDLADLMSRKESRAVRNATFSMFKGSLGWAESLEKFKTNAIQTREKYERDSYTYDQLVDESIDGFRDDDNLKMPIQGKFEMRGVRIGPSMAPSSGFARMKLPIPDTKPEPQAAFQRQLTRNGVTFSAEDTTPEKIGKLEDQIVDGSVTSEDVRSFLGVAEAGIAYWKERENTAGVSEEDKKFSRRNRRDIQSQQRAVIGLRSKNQKKIKGSTGVSVATIVNDALGPTHQKYAPSFGADLLEYQQTAGTDYRAMFEEVTKSFEPDEPLEIPEGASKDLIFQINKANARMATIFSDEETSAEFPLDRRY